MVYFYSFYFSLPELWGWGWERGKGDRAHKKSNQNKKKRPIAPMGRFMSMGELCADQGMTEHNCAEIKGGVNLEGNK